MSLREWAALLLAGILLGSAWILVVVPERERARGAARELAQLDAQILSAEQALRTLVSIEREIGEGKQRLQRLQGRIQGTRNLQRILIVLSRNAEELGVKIVSMRPLGERAPSSSVPTRQFPVEMELRGRFLDLGRYLEGLRAAPLLLTVEGVRLTRADTDSRLALRMVAVTHIRPRGQ